MIINLSVIGETGWYLNNEQLYYFCIDKGEYILLCGPLSVDLYDAAVEELDKFTEYKKNSSSSYPLNLQLDRLGLHATRIQIETLLDDLWHLDQILKNTEDELILYKNLVAHDQYEQFNDDGVSITVNKNSNAFIKLTSIMRGFLARTRVKKMVSTNAAMSTGVLIATSNTEQGG